MIDKLKGDTNKQLKEKRNTMQERKKDFDKKILRKTNRNLGNEKLNEYNKTFSGRQNLKA